MMDLMEPEIMSLLKVWITILASLTYCYFISKNIPKGFFRLLSILPIVSIFLYLPLNLHYSIHLSGLTGFFISWLANFKLLLFSFDQGPLSSSLTLPLFISMACLPIKVNQKPNPSQQIKIKQNPLKYPEIKPKPPLDYAIKVVLLAFLLKIYEYKPHLHPNFITFLYCFHTYFFIELLLAMGAALARFLLGLELEPQFNDPYLSTSLQDFWGRRWNLIVTGILRPTVYEPVMYIVTRILGRRWAPFIGVVSTFLVSGLMHELLYYYVTHVDPTWEVTWFFVLHGICTALEVKLKKRLSDRWRLTRWVSGLLTLVFIAVTGFWLFFPQVLRHHVDVKAIAEYGILIDFVKKNTMAMYKFFS